MTANTSAEKYSADFTKSEVIVTDHVDGEKSGLIWQTNGPSHRGIHLRARKQ